MSCTEMRDCLSNFPSAKLSIYTTVIVIFTYNFLLERDFECTCKPQTTDCSLHMALPFFIIFFLILWMNRKFQRTWKFTCTFRCQCPLSVCENAREQCGDPLLSVLISHMMKAALVGLLWVASVLIDGDWYVCCKNNGSKQQKQLACKQGKSITAEEQRIMAELENYSKVIGLGLLITIIVIGALMSLFGWRKWCEGKLGCCDRKVLYDKLILEEERQVLKEILREDAKKKLKEEIERKIEAIGWKDCFDVAEEVIKTIRLNIPNMESQQLEQLREQSAEQSPEQPQRQDAQGSENESLTPCVKLFAGGGPIKCNKELPINRAKSIAFIMILLVHYTTYTTTVIFLSFTKY